MPVLRATQVHQILQIGGLQTDRVAVMGHRLLPGLAPAENTRQVVLRVREVGPERDRAQVDPLRPGILAAILAGRAEVVERAHAVRHDHQRAAENRVIVPPLPQAQHAARREQQQDHRNRDEDATPAGGGPVEGPRSIDGRPCQEAEADRGEVEKPLRHDGADRQQEIGHREERESHESERERDRRRAPPAQDKTGQRRRGHGGAAQGCRIEKSRNDRDGVVGVIDRLSQRQDQQQRIPGRHRERGPSSHQEGSEGDRVIEKMDLPGRVQPAESLRARRQTGQQHRPHCQMMTPGEAAADDGAIREKPQEEGRHGILLGQEAGAERGDRETGEQGGAPPLPRGSSPGALQKAQERDQRSRGRQKLGSADHLAEDFGMDRMNREQQGRGQRRIERRGRGAPENPAPQQQDENADQRVQRQVDRAEAEGTGTEQRHVERERQDGHRAVQDRKIDRADAPVAVRHDLGRPGESADQLVLLDDSMIVVDEPGREGAEVHDAGDQSDETRRPPAARLAHRPRLQNLTGNGRRPRNRGSGAGPRDRAAAAAPLRRAPADPMRRSRAGVSAAPPSRGGATR